MLERKIICQELLINHRKNRVFGKNAGTKGKAMKNLIKVHVAEPVFGQQLGQQGLHVHPASACVGRPCPFHNPSNHKMKNWPINVRLDNKGLVERFCTCGVAHPDPDSVAYFRGIGIDYMSVHSCDGCCSDIK